MKTFIAVALSLAASAGAAHSAALFAFEEIGGNVVGELTGNLDVDGLASDSAGLGESAFVRPNRPSIGIARSFTNI